MSLTIPGPRAAKFLDRFEHVRTALRRSHVALGWSQTVLAAGLGLAALAALDYQFELATSSRAAGLAVAAVLVLAVLAARVVGPVRWWSRPRTAAMIERRFPQLGQRIRTVVQYGDLSDERIDEEGVAPALVGALEDETEQRSRPLRLDAVVPRRRVVAAAALAALPALVIVAAAVSDPEWRTAVRRALLGRVAYTTLAVTPGDVRIEQGEDVPFAVVQKGRPRRDVVLYTRPADRPDEPWASTPMKPQDGERARGAAVPRVATREKIMRPFVYRVVAGPAASPTYTVAVRYPLAVKSLEVGLTPPAYTRVPPSTVKGGDVQATEGTVATFRVAFDAPPAEAALVLTDPSLRPKKGQPDPKPLVLPLKPSGPAHVASLTLAKGGYYRIEARTADGRVLPKNRYRIDVHEDRAPRVAFEEPDEALEVHPVAEVRHRVRVGDDFGLTRAGIVFRFNDGAEQTLLLKTFADGPSDRPITAATLEEMLLLETLKATPTDSVTYYAFAEDNYPSGARRTETDLRYLDIRPFRREYKSADGEPDDSGGESTSLAELIARQRFNLNRGVRLARRRPTDRSPADDPLKIASFEEALVGLVREFTEGLEGIAGERVEPLHQAEEAMLAAVDALDRGKFEASPPPMAEALRHLIEVRRTFRVLIGKGGAAARAARNFDRTQTQKIRKPKGKDEEAEALAAELEQLAQDEDFVYATLSGLALDDSPPPAPGPADTGNPAENPDAKDQEKDAEKDPKTPDAKDAPTRGATGSGGQGPKGERGQGGKKDPAKGDPKGDPEDRDGPAGRKPNDRKEATERQERIADDARALEERLKRLEVASDLARARMAKAAEAAEKAASALARGSTKEGTEAARAGALMFHELARQVKGEISREVADELAMARDLADELARREDEFSRGSDGPPDPNAPPGTGEKGEKGEKGRGGKGEKGQPGSGSGAWGGWGDWSALTDAEKVERLEEAARTLREWLQGAGKNAEGATAERVREVMEQGPVAEVVERAERVGTLYLGGQKPESRREARDLARTLEALARQLDVLHRGIVAPELARLVEFDRRAAELTARLKTLKTEAQVAEWHRLAAALVRDLEKAGMGDAAGELGRVVEAAGRAAGGYHWGAAVDGWLTAPRRVHQRPDVRGRAAPGPRAGPGPQGPGLGPRRGDAAGVPRAGRAVLPGALLRGGGPGQVTDRGGGGSRPTGTTRPTLTRAEDR